NAGYPKAMAHLLSRPSVLPFGFLGERVRNVIATFPALYQILPNAAYVKDQRGKPIDVFADESWLAAEQQVLLRDAQAFRRELGTQSSVPTVCIFGYGQKTLAGVRVQQTPKSNWEQVEFDYHDEGDVHIPAASAVIKSAEIHPVLQQHGSLYVDNDVRMRLKLELTRQV
ncbi:MAG TPA: hypothetical protein P5121_18210, partial [Caldilineaceae bacterium]|nr:hypothetical protein [Caldilineaceae bacterium]